ncbi:MAG: hypothetical protein JWN75_105 [Candidatus Saccharibacteria bacterium]|nr:hypothetical protein [Candidatus Saccharibacteria bacterium]
MTNPNMIQVSAFIPNQDGDRYIVALNDTDKKEELPTKSFLPGEHGTYEGTLNAIAAEVTGSYGKVDQRMPEKEIEANHIVYRTHPIAGAAIIASNYSWNRLD